MTAADGHSAHTNHPGRVRAAAAAPWAPSGGKPSWGSLDPPGAAVEPGPGPSELLPGSASAAAPQCSPTLPGRVCALCLASADRAVPLSAPPLDHSQPDSGCPRELQSHRVCSRVRLQPKQGDRQGYQPHARLMRSPCIEPFPFTSVK